MLTVQKCLFFAVCMLFFTQNLLAQAETTSPRAPHYKTPQEAELAGLDRMAANFEGHVVRLKAAINQKDQGKIAYQEQHIFRFLRERLHTAETAGDAATLAQCTRLLNELEPISFGSADAVMVEKGLAHLAELGQLLKNDADKAKRQ
jgi:hypothetical protein